MRFPQDYVYVLRRHRKLALAVFVTVLASTVALILFVPPRYQASATLLIPPSSGLGAAGAMLSAITGLGPGTSPETQLEIIASRPNLEKVIGRLHLDMRPEDLRKRVSVMHPKLTDVVKVRAEGETPRQAADIANTLVNAYLEDQERRYRSETGTAAGDVKKRLAEVEERLRLKEAELTAWLKEKRLAVPDQEMQAAVERLDQTIRAEEATRAESARLEAENRALRHRLAALEPRVAGREVFRASPVVEALRTKLGDLYARRAAALYEYKPDQPEVQVVEAQIASVEASLRETLVGAVQGELLQAEREEQSNPVREKAIEMLVANEVARASTRAKLDSLAVQSKRIGAQIEKLPALAHELGELRREREALEKVWSSLAARYEELKVQQYAGALRPQLIEPATPPIRKSRPRPVLWSVVGFLVACVLSVTSCAVVEGLDRRVITPRDARDLLKLPALGVYSTPLTGEDADTLWARLTLYGAASRWHTLLLVSTGAATSIGAALAEAAARANARPLLVSQVCTSPLLTTLYRTLSVTEPRVEEAARRCVAEGGVVLIETTLVQFGGSVGLLRTAERVLLLVEQGVSADRLEEEFLEALRHAGAELLGVAILGSSARFAEEAAA